VLSADWLKREARRAKWTDDYRQEVKASLDNHLSALAALPVAEITTAIAAKPIRKVEDSAPDMATKVRQRLRSIMDYAAEQGLIPINPIPAARRGKRSAQRTHLAAVTDHAGVGAILRAADVAEISRGVRRAHLLAVFTAQRIGAIAGARWDEFDLQAGAWSIPRERMQWKDAQRGPMSCRCLNCSLCYANGTVPTAMVRFTQRRRRMATGQSRAKRSRNSIGERWNLPASIRRIPGAPFSRLGDAMRARTPTPSRRSSIT
jgi:integrase